MIYCLFLAYPLKWNLVWAVCLLGTDLRVTRTACLNKPASEGGRKLDCPVIKKLAGPCFYKRTCKHLACWSASDHGEGGTQVWRVKIVHHRDQQKFKISWSRIAIPNEVVLHLWCRTFYLTWNFARSAPLTQCPSYCLCTLPRKEAP